MSQVHQLGPKVCSHLVLFCIHRVNWVNSHNHSESWWQHHKHCPRIIIIIYYICLKFAKHAAMWHCARKESTLYLLISTIYIVTCTFWHLCDIVLLLFFNTEWVGRWEDLVVCKSIPLRHLPKVPFEGADITPERQSSYEISESNAV